jgi:hypothetical protein
MAQLVHILKNCSRQYYISGPHQELINDCANQ